MEEEIRVWIKKKLKEVKTQETPKTEKIEEKTEKEIITKQPQEPKPKTVTYEIPMPKPQTISTIEKKEPEIKEQPIKGSIDVEKKIEEFMQKRTSTETSEAIELKQEVQQYPQPQQTMESTKPVQQQELKEPRLIEKIEQPQVELRTELKKSTLKTKENSLMKTILIGSIMATVGGVTGYLVYLFFFS